MLRMIPTGDKKEKNEEEEEVKKKKTWWVASAGVKMLKTPDADCKLHKTYYFLQINTLPFKVFGCLLRKFGIL